jgi:catechol 2,3-dioxygenase-like lactoylglutathione lyase family enzyme
MDFVGIDQVVFGADDLVLARKFFTDWGLKKVKQSPTHLIFETGNSSQVVVRQARSEKLAPPLSADAQFREFVLGVASQRHFDQLEKELTRDRTVTFDAEGVLHSVDDSGISIGFRLNTRQPVDLPTLTARNEPGNRQRVDQVSTFYKSAQPWQMGHIVFFVADVRAAENFYRKRLGFWLSDRYVGGAGVFLRWAKRSEHHNLFLLKSPTAKPSLHHLAFEVRDPHEVFGGGLAFSGKGWPTKVGPGRHPISSAYFWYFKNPLGGAIEYFCDPDFVTEDWKPHQYRVNRFSEWHLSQGIEPHRDDFVRPSLASSKAIDQAMSQSSSAIST